MADEETVVPATDDTMPAPAAQDTPAPVATAAVDSAVSGADQTVETPVVPPEVAAAVPPPHDVPAAPASASEPAEGPNLEQERDDRVIPVVRGVLADLAGIETSVDVNDRSQFTNVIVSILKRTLAADLNVQMDTSYVFQLALTAFGALNQFAMSCKMADSQEERYSRIAHEMMQLLSSANVPIGMRVNTPDQVAALEVIRPQMEAIFARENLTKFELSYILEGLLNAFKVTESVYAQNIDDSVKRMEAKVLGIDDMSDLTMNKLDWALSTSIEDILAAEKPKEDVPATE